jgi:hypothetical protein
VLKAGFHQIYTRHIDATADESQQWKESGRNEDERIACLIAAQITKESQNMSPKPMETITPQGLETFNQYDKAM